MNHPVLTAITRYQNHQFIRKQCSISLCRPKDFIQHFSRGSQLPPSTPWSIFLENKCLRSSASLWCHSDGTFRQLSVFQKGCYLFDKNNAKKKIYIYIFCTGRLPSLKQPNQLPARTLQPRRSGMFFRWAGIQRPDSQKLAIHANRVQELKENNGLIGFYRSGISMNKFW